MEDFKRIDGFGISEIQSEGTKPEELLRDVVIIYYSDKEIVNESQVYSRIPEERVRHARAELNYIELYNLNQGMSKVIPLETIINKVEKILLNKD